MNFRFALLSIKLYGIKGVLSYIHRKFSSQNPARLIARKIDKNIVPSPGITIIATLDYPGSLSKAMRDFIILLKKADIPCQAMNLSCHRPIPDNEYKYLLTPESEFVTNRYTEIVTMRQGFNIPDKRCRVHAVEFWEFEDGFEVAHPEMLILPNLIAMSDFNLHAYRKMLPKSSVRKILYPFQFSHGPLAPIDMTRRKYGIPPDAFMVFFNFDYASSYVRKNPEAILRAFRNAFTKDEPAAVVFKTMRAKAFADMSARLHSIAHELMMDKQLITIDDYIPQEDLVNLTNACNCYISLHRGEGFGLGIAEAMKLRKPVIVTDYSSTTEFCNIENSIPIPYKMVPVKSEGGDVGPYSHVTRWAEPDIDAAAKALRRLYDSPELQIELGTKAKTFIDNYFSVKNFKNSVDEFLFQ